MATEPAEDLYGTNYKGVPLEDSERVRLENHKRAYRRQFLWNASKVAAIGTAAAGATAVAAYAVNPDATLDLLSTIGNAINDFWQNNADYLGNHLGDIGNANGQMIEAAILALAIALIVAVTYYFLKPLPIPRPEGVTKDESDAQLEEGFATTQLKGSEGFNPASFAESVDTAEATGAGILVL